MEGYQLFQEVGYISWLGFIEVQVFPTDYGQKKGCRTVCLTDSKVLETLTKTKYGNSQDRQVGQINIDVNEKLSLDYVMALLPAPGHIHIRFC